MPSSASRRIEPAQARSARVCNIGQAAKVSGVTAKMIRHYESIGLIPQTSRSEGNYRLYGEKELHTLRFVRRGRSLGFSVKQIAELLSLWENRSRNSGSVRRLALEHVSELERKIHELEEMARTLKYLANTCRGNSRPECPILDDFALTRTSRRAF